MRFLRSILIAMGLASLSDQRDVVKKARTANLRKPRRKSQRANRRRHDPVFAAGEAIQKIEARRNHRSLHPKHIDRLAGGTGYTSAPQGMRWYNDKLIPR